MGSVAAGLVGAVISLAAVVVGVWLNSRREHRHWLREQRMRAAVDFVTAVHHLLNQYRLVGMENMDQVDRREWRNRMQSARTSLYLLCSSPTVKLAEELSQLLFATTPDIKTDETSRAYSTLGQVVDSLRKELSRQSTK